MALSRVRYRLDTTPDTDSTSDLNGAISTTSETSITVDDGTDFEVNQNIKIDSEEMTITAISSNTLTVVRGVNGTTAATHTDNTSVFKDDSTLYTPNRNPNIASEQPKEYDGIVARKSLSGKTYTVANHSTSRISRKLAYSNLNNANKDKLIALFDYAKGQLNTFQYSDDGDTWYTVRFVNNKLNVTEVAYNAFNVDVEIEEQL